MFEVHILSVYYTRLRMVLLHLLLLFLFDLLWLYQSQLLVAHRLEVLVVLYELSLLLLVHDTQCVEVLFSTYLVK